MILGSKPIVYGYVAGVGHRQIIGHVPLAASVAFKNNGGKFVTINATNNRAALSVAGDTVVHGWADVGEFTSNSTAGRDLIPIDISKESKYWIPASVAVTRAIVGETCDIVVTAGGIQQANVAASSTDVLYIWDVDITNQLVLVSIATDPAPRGVV